MLKFKTFSSLIYLLIFLIIAQCGLYKKVDTREVPTNAQERARKAVQEGKGIGIGNILKGGGTNFEFSSSNPLWRASLEVLDFLPLSNVDYSGGMIISDWYSASGLEKEAIKISLRFLSNEIRSDSLKITVFKKNCTVDNNCSVSAINTKLREELVKTIISKAAELDKEDKKKK
jgi:hypothetical protein